MSSLREIRDHIASVRGTLKITSAMKLVASSKLRRAQKAIETLLPYQEALSLILASLAEGCTPSEEFRATELEERRKRGDLSSESGVHPSGSGDPDSGSNPCLRRRAVVVIAGNSAMCGAFNANAVKAAVEVVERAGGANVFALGRKAEEGMRRAGFPSAGDWSPLVAHPSYEAAAALAARLASEYSEVTLVYNHFVSTSRQEVLCEPLFPAPEVMAGLAAGVAPDSEERSPRFLRSSSSVARNSSLGAISSSNNGNSNSNSNSGDYIVEPGAEEVRRELAPKVLALKLYGVILDSAAAEHSARMLAMQTATDNAESLLSDLTLEYNKGRQQKITSEILDLIGGSIA